MTTASAKIPIDGWRALFESSTAVMVVQQIAPPGSPAFGAAFQSCLQLKATTGAAIGSSVADQVRLYAHIEGYRTARLGFGTSTASPVTIAFWVYASAAGTMNAAFANAAADRSYVTNIVINSAATWEYKTVTIPGDQSGAWDRANLIGSRLSFSFGTGTNLRTAANTWTAGFFLGTPASSTNFFTTNNNIVCITGVTILPGAQAPTAAQSPTVMRPYDQELVTCQRYYRHYGGVNVNEPFVGGQCYSTTGAQVFGTLEPSMRAGPTITPVGNLGIAMANSNQVAVTNLVTVVATSYLFSANATVASGLVVGDATKLAANSDINARLKFDARL